MGHDRKGRGLACPEQAPRWQYSHLPGDRLVEAQVSRKPRRFRTYCHGVAMNAEGHRVVAAGRSLHFPACYSDSQSASSETSSVLPPPVTTLTE